MNVMFRPRGVVDEALESLHRALKNQDAIKPPPVEPRPEAYATVPEREVSVSGARAKTRPTRRKIEAASERQTRKRKKTAPTAQKRPVAKSQRLKASEMNAVINHVSQRIARLEHFGTDQEPMKKLLEEAKAAQRKKRDARATETLAKVRREISIQEIQIIRDILSDAQAKFVAARRAGIDIGPAVRLLMLSKQHLRKCDLERAAELAKLGSKKVEESLEAHREAESLASTAARAVAMAESIGAGIPEARGMMTESRARFEKGEYEPSISSSKKLLTIARERSQQRARECVDLAERSLELAKESEADTSSARESLEKSKQHLEKMELAQSIKLSNSSMLESNEATLSAMRERTGRIGDFAKGVSGEVESLSQVQDAIVHSRERNLEMIRKYAYLTEEIVSQAYDTAASYSRVSQDIVKQAYDSSVEIDPSAMDSDVGASYGMASAIGRALSVSNEDRRLRIIDMFLSGKMNENQLERLLVLLDASIPKVELADMIARSDIPRT